MNLKGDSKRGQVTIFIIIAIVIVAGILIYSFSIKPHSAGKNTPRLGFENCVSKALEDKVEELAETGGYRGEFASFRYLNTEVPYFCYTGKDLELCTIQNPAPKKLFEEQLRREVIPDVESCYDSSILSLKLQGYNVEKGDVDVTLDINSKSIDINLKAPTTVEGSTFEEFSYSFSSNIYETLILATEILNTEITVGEVDILDYIYIYPNLIVRRLVQDEGSVVYIIEDKNSETKFQFAVRNLYFPPGYTA
jgi:hypothetical protein